jgi:hypothetical protein
MALGRVIMSMLGDVFGSLESMSQLQLLLAFIACIGYALGQGRLLPSRGRRIAWGSAALAAAGFAFESSDWTHATVLLGFAVVGIGSFVAVVWLTSRALGIGRVPVMPPPPEPAEPASSAAPAVPGAKQRPARPGDPAPSL